MKNIGATKYLGQTINGIKITPAALLGGAHIGGQGKVNDLQMAYCAIIYVDKILGIVSQWVGKASRI